MTKRVTYLRKQPGLDRADFRSHWQFIHGPIAARFAHLEAYRQNVVTAELSSQPGSETPADGIVELWFESIPGVAPGRDPDVTAALVADELKFLAGLIGSEVEADRPYAPSAHKVWFVGQWAAAHAGAEELHRAADSIREVYGRVGFSVRTQHVPEGTEHFTREALDSGASLYDAAVIICLGDKLPSPVELSGLKTIGEAALDGILQSVRCYLVEENVIV